MSTNPIDKDKTKKMWELIGILNTAAASVDYTLDFDNVDIDFKGEKTIAIRGKVDRQALLEKVVALNRKPLKTLTPDDFHPIEWWRGHAQAIADVIKLIENDE